MNRNSLFLGISFLVIVALHAVFQAGPFLSMDWDPAWDTFFYFPTFFYSPAASLLSDGSLPWWSPLSQEGIPLYYLLFATYHPLFPTTLILLGASWLDGLLGFPVSVYQLYIIQQLLLNPALLVFLAMLVSRRLFKHPLAHVSVMALVSFSGNNIIHVFNAHYYTVNVVSLLFLYSFLLYYQTRTAGSRLLLGFVMVFLAINAFSMYVLQFMMYAIPLFLLFFYVFHRRSTVRSIKDFFVRLDRKASACLVLAILVGALSSLAVILINVNVLKRDENLVGFDPLNWRHLPNIAVRVRDILPELKRMFVDFGEARYPHVFLGVATLPFAVIGLFLGRGRARFAFFLTFVAFLFIMSVNVVYVLLCNALSWMQMNRHCGEIMYFGGSHFAIFLAGYGVDSIFGRRDARTDSEWALRLLVSLAFAAAAFAFWRAQYHWTNVCVWLIGAALVAFLSSARRPRSAVAAVLVIVVMGFAGGQLLAYNGPFIRGPAKPKVFPPRFEERGWDLDFLMTGSYISDNSILGGSQGYFFGDEVGTPPLAAHHGSFNYMRPKRLGQLKDNMPQHKYTQIIGDYLPRIRFPEKVCFVGSPSKVLAVLENSDNFGKKAVLELNVLDEDRMIEINPEFASGRPVVRIKDFGFNHLKLEVEASDDCFLYYADGYDRFWYARVNGESSPIYPANLVHKAVWIPKGKTEVVFEYNPWPVRVLYMACFLFTLGFAYHLVRSIVLKQETGTQL